MEPPPTIKANLGRRRSFKALLGVRYLTVSVPVISEVLRREPVAMMKVFAVYFFLPTAMVCLSRKLA